MSVTNQQIVANFRLKNIQDPNYNQTGGGVNRIFNKVDKVIGRVGKSSRLGLTEYAKTATVLQAAKGKRGRGKGKGKK